MSIEYLSALVIEPNSTKRGYLWQATRSEPRFYRVNGTKSLPDALEILKEGKKFDVILLPGHEENKSLEHFLLEAKKTTGGIESAYVIVTTAGEKDRERIANFLLSGFDGFLFSPYSVNNLKDVAVIAAKVKRKFESQRKKAALQILLPSISQSLDNYALALQNKSTNLEEKKKEFKDSVEPIEEIALEFPIEYLDLITEIFETASPREIPSYRGASQRVKAKLSNKKK